MKAALNRADLPVAAGLGEVGRSIPVIVKSAIEHASLGISEENVVTGAGAAMMLIAERQAEYGGEWFAEEYIDGREFNVAILDGKALPVAEILFLDHADRPKIVGYEEKWATGSAADETTPRVFLEDETLAAELQGLAMRCWDAFALTGYARVDFRVDLSGRPYILEVNANPCLSADAGFCAAAARAGLTQTDVVAQLLAAAQA
jgi:D-alanine-D-alanine ligase